MNYITFAEPHMIIRFRSREKHDNDADFFHVINSEY